MKDVVDLIFEQAMLQPDHPAIADGEIKITYGELRDRACRLAAGLAQYGNHPKVLILLDQGADAYVAMVATAIAGGYYAPTNGQSPIGKLQSIARQFAPDVVVSHAERYATVLGDQDGAAPLLDAIGQFPVGLESRRRSHRLIYVMFTSGSTGAPKGVRVLRSALNHYTDWSLATIAPTPDDRWSQHPNIAFDMSHFDIYGALCSGGTLCAFGSAMDRMMPALGIRRYGITIWNSVPSVVSQMAQAKQVTAANLASLRLMNFCGEALLPEHLDAVFAARPDLRVHNTYGPTEATISCTLLRLDAGNYSRSCRANVAIGDAIPNMEIHLVGGPNDDEGEIVITGPQLADGYWNDPEATRKAFHKAQVGNETFDGYYTGDWARRVDGQVYFSTRIDFQVKIRGIRLELEEIDAALRKCGFMNAATALIDDELHAFLETSQATLDDAALRRNLAELVEPHAIPAHFHPIPQMPRNANDKIDVKSLTQTFRTSLSSGGVA